MKKILVIDDEKSVADAVCETIEDAFPDVRCIGLTDFSEAIKCLSDERPDAIVLDLMEGSDHDNLPGQATWASVWDGNFFCPLIIYTGWEGDLVPSVPAEHPFVKVIAKGAASLALLVEALKAFVPAVEAIRMLNAEIDGALHQVLRVTAGEGVVSLAETDHLLHAARRRLAAAMDDHSTAGGPLKYWEHYLIPAIGDSPRTADLLRVRDSDVDDPEAYRVVLTPSCDLVRGRCIPTVLVAKCLKGSKLIQLMSLSTKENKREEMAERCRKGALSAGVYDGYLPLPAFGTRIPHLLANLKNLEVIRYDAIGSQEDEKEFVRIASIDSPFREQIAWAYLTTAGRPGVPDRDLIAWATELLEQCED